MTRTPFVFQILTESHKKCLFLQHTEGGRQENGTSLKLVSEVIISYCTVICQVQLTVLVYVGESFPFSCVFDKQYFHSDTYFSN